MFHRLANYLILLLKTEKTHRLSDFSNVNTLFELLNYRIKKEKYLHYHIFITEMCLTRGSISVPITSTKLLMVFDCKGQLSFDLYAMVLPLKRLYKGMLFQITE